MLDMLPQLIKDNKADGFTCFAQRFALKLMDELVKMRKSKVSLKGEVWKNLNFNALGLNAQAKLHLNPVDEGFSKEFYSYGFREPLNTYAMFKTIQKKKPTVLDIGSNLGYFALVELQAGAKHVIAIEPVPLTFSYLSKTLEDYKNLTILNIAVSDKNETLKLYVANEFNITSSQVTLVKSSGHNVFKEINVPAVPISSLAEEYPINMIRMDVEGHEYSLLGGDIPDQIETICLELHLVPPYGKKDVIKLFKNLDRQGFKAAMVINEMPHGFYPLIKHLGLEMTYKLVKSLKEENLSGINLRLNLNLMPLVDDIKGVGIVHLILQK
jgi:FkbM family methyltransferase